MEGGSIQDYACIQDFGADFPQKSQQKIVFWVIPAYRILGLTFHRKVSRK